MGDVKKSGSGFPGSKVDLQVQILWDDRIGGSIYESKFDRRNAICREVLSLNEYGVDEGVGGSGIHKDFSPVFEGCLDVKESVSESWFWKSECIEVMIFAWGSSTQSSGHVGFEDCSVFFQVRVGGRGLLLISLWHSSLGGGWGRDFGKSLQHVQRCHKTGKVLSDSNCLSWGWAFHLCWVQGRSGVVDFFLFKVVPLLW